MTHDTRTRSGRHLRALLVPVLTLTFASPAAADEVVTSGPWRATVRAAPWRVVLEQPGGATLAGGALSFTTLLGERRATRALTVRRDGDALLATLATDDPAGRTIDARLAPAGDGVLALSARVGGVTADVTAMAATFERPAAERHFGLGERADALDHAGRTVEDQVSDGPFTASTRPFVRATIPPQGFRDRDDATYYPVPWMLSSRGYGALLDGGRTSRWHLGSDRADSWTADVDGAAMTLRLFAGPTPARALGRFTAATGRQPRPQAPWAYGPWLQTGQPSSPPVAEERADLARLRAADAPVSAAETQLRYLPCGLDRGNEAYERDRVDWYHARGLAVLTYVNPMVCASYEPLFAQAAASGALQRDVLGAPAVFNSFVGGIGPVGFTVQPVAQVDLGSDAGRALYRGVLRRIVDAGHDGWMEDFGEYTPDGAVPADGTPPAEAHNTYPRSYHCGVREIVASGLAPRPIVRFQRSGWTGAAACADDVWGGDPTTSFGFDGLRSVVLSALGMGLSGVSRWGSDIGGYDTIADDPKLTPELLQRWIEVGAVSGVMRMKKSGLAIPAYTRPQPWDPGIIGTWRRYTKLHTQLYPYIAAAERTYRATGVPLMRALVLDDPDDPRAVAADDEFRFGPDLLAAPVLTAGATSRGVYLPHGRWFDGRTALRYDAPGAGGLHVGRGAHALRGGRVVRAAAAVDELPLYVRAGAVLPLLSPDVSTLSAYGAGSVVRLADRRDRLVLLAFPRGRSRSEMFEGETLRSATRRGRWTLSIAGARVRRYDVEASLAAVPGLGRVCSVTANGRAVRRWSSVSRVLHARVRGRHVRLDVRGCPAGA